MQTVYTPDAGDRYVFSMSCSRLSVGAHTARAVVTYRLSNETTFTRWANAARRAKAPGRRRMHARSAACTFPGSGSGCRNGATT